jgi:predicted ribosome-associated RNA-binding protein Tma20
MSNAKTRQAEPQQPQPSLAETASRMFGKPSAQYLNAMTIATSEAIADTGATSIFIMEGADVKNK